MKRDTKLKNLGISMLAISAVAMAGAQNSCSSAGNANLNPAAGGANDDPNLSAAGKPEGGANGQPSPNSASGAGGAALGEGGDSSAAGSSSDGEGGLGGEGGSGADPGLFVDPISGVDGRSCRLSEPCRTLSFALTVASEGMTIFLEPGNYTEASGETFDKPVPAGVTIESKVAGQAVLLSKGENGGVAFRVPNGATLRYLHVRGFESGVRAQAGALVLEGVDFTDVTYPLLFEGTSDVTVNGGIITGAFYAIEVKDTAKANVTDVKLVEAGKVPQCNITGLIAYARNSAKLTLEEIDGQSLKGLLRLDDDATLSIANSSLVGVTDPDCMPAVAVSSSQQTSVSGTTFKNFAPVSLDNATVTGSTFQNAPIGTSGTVSITNSSIRGPEGMRAGVGISAGGTLSLTDSSFRGLKTGLNLASWNSVKKVHMRGSTFLENEVGVDLSASPTQPPTALMILDFGTTSDPGNNNFAGNVSWALRIAGTNAQSLPAAGNSWNAGVQGADANGKMASGQKLTGPYVTAGTNFRIEQAGPTIQF